MALIDGPDYKFDIEEWWTAGGEHDGRDSPRYRKGTPTRHELENRATRLTGKITYRDGQEVYYNIYSPIGWLIDELERQVDNAASYYETQDEVAR